MSDVISQISSLAGVWLTLGVGICSALIVVVADWRISLVAFALQTTLLAFLGTRLVPPGWALLRMLVGGLVAIIWFLSARGVRWGERAEPTRWWRLRRGRGERWPIISTPVVMRFLSVVLAALVLFRLEIWTRFPALPPDLAVACLWLWLMGFLALALSGQPLRAGLGLLTITGGIQLLVQALDPRPADIGILAGLDLLLALSFAYLVIAAGLPGRPALARRAGVQITNQLVEPEERS